MEELLEVLVLGRLAIGTIGCGSHGGLIERNEQRVGGVVFV